MKFSSHLWMAPLPLSMAFPSMFHLYAPNGKVKSGLDVCVGKLGSGDPDREAGLV